MSNRFILPFLLLFFAYFIISLENFTIILSGIAIFLVGMMFMQDGFKLLSGGILEKLLQKFTSNIFYSILTGFLSTTFVQSSSIISLVVISFLSVELLTLIQGIGIIFGSNLGSTTTAWIISSLGFDVKISSYALPMILFGVILKFIKSNAYKGLGNVLLGLGFVFLGIAYMKDGFDTLKNSIDLASFAMEGALGIVVYLIVGAIATIIIQSSAATIAIIITALSAGSIIYINALALVIGANIGTTFTAILASLASNENGKRVAFAHFLFNIITGVIITIFIYSFRDLVDFLAPYFGISENNYSMKLALFHTLFSLIGIILLTPFINQIVNVSKNLIKKKVSTQSKPKYLLDTNLTIPETAIVSIKKETVNLYENCQKAMLHALNLHTTNLRTKDDLDKQISKDNEKIDTNIDEIYQTNLKNLYSEIIRYASFAQENMSSPQQKEVWEIKRCAKIIVEVLKDTRDIQKNLNFYLKSRNDYIKEEYNLLRKELASTLIEIHLLENHEKELEKLTQLEVIKSALKSNDIITSGKIDALIREDKIKATMATSLINDSATVHSIQKKLVEIANILFISNTILKEIGETNNETR